jgi:hypothetical protein
MSALKVANLTLAFLLELGVLAALAYWGWVVGPNTPAKAALAVGAPVVAIIIWAIWGAPRSPRRLKGLWNWLLRVIFNICGALALVAAGQRLAGVIFILVALLNMILAYIWGQ